MLFVVSRLYAHSKNYDMDLTLDYNIELFPLQQEQSFAMALASSLARGGAAAGASGADGTDDAPDDKQRDVWRPDGKGRRGLEDDYDYVMYGKVRYCFSCILTNIKLWTNLKVYKFDGGTTEIVYASALCLEKASTQVYSFQYCLCVIWWASYVLDRLFPAYDEHCTRRPSVSPDAKIVDCYYKKKAC